MKKRHKRLLNRRRERWPKHKLRKRYRNCRNRYRDWKRIAYPMIAVWLIWTCIEIYLIYGHDAIWFCSGGIFGGLIGGIFGTRMNNKVIHTADELLGQIKDYETEL